MDLSLSTKEEEELAEMFFLEAQERHQRLNELLPGLEADLKNALIIDEILRITHTLKGNSMGMKQDGIAELCHTMEEVIEAHKVGDITLDASFFEGLYGLTDKIGKLIQNLKEGKRISHKGIKTKIEVLLREARKNEGEVEGSQVTPEPVSKKENSDFVEIKSKEVSKPISKSFLDLKQFLSSRVNLLFQKPKPKEVHEEVLSTKPSFDKDDRPNRAQNDEQSVIELFGGTTTIKEIEPDDNVVTIADMVQVPIRKLDLLMNQVGQLIIERDRLMSIEELNRSRKAEFASLQRITSDIQYSVMDVRLVQVGTLFNKFHRVARDVAALEKKEVRLVLEGNDVEIDRNILKVISDSMVHLVRNAVSHGIENVDSRKIAGKPEEGSITLNAKNDNDNVIIEVTDDGAGIDATKIRSKLVSRNLLTEALVSQLSDEEIIMHIFDTGFSNASQVSEVSGRGVGMDVVKKATESIGGQVEVQTEVGKGTTFRLRLPASMAVKGVLMFMVNKQEYAVALPYTEAVISLKKKDIHKAGVGLMSSYLKETISIIFLSDLLAVKDFSEIYSTDLFHGTFDSQKEDQFEVIIISYSGRSYGIIVDKLLQQKDVIEKPLPKPLDDNKLLGGTTIMGNGNVCLIIDVVSITDILFSTRYKIQEQLKAS